MISMTTCYDNKAILYFCFTLTHDHVGVDRFLSTLTLGVSSQNLSLQFSLQPHSVPCWYMQNSCPGSVVAPLPRYLESKFFRQTQKTRFDARARAVPLFLEVQSSTTEESTRKWIYFLMHPFPNRCLVPFLSYSKNGA